jgi:long-subunit acyl-CoA synthetase (AMP-forming)
MLYPVSPCDVPRVWDAIGEHLKKSFDKSPIPIPEEKVYLEVAEDRMKLFLLTEGTKMKGMVLFRIEDHFGTKVLNSFALSCDSDYGELEQDMEQALEIAKLLGCSHLIGYGRRGFSKTLPLLGFKHLQTVMVKEV